QDFIRGDRERMKHPDMQEISLDAFRRENRKRVLKGSVGGTPANDRHVRVRRPVEAELLLLGNLLQHELVLAHALLMHLLAGLWIFRDVPVIVMLVPGHPIGTSLLAGI